VTEGPQGEETVWSLLATAAACHPTRPALNDGHEVLTYAELMRHVDEVARGLAALGLRQGDRVGLATGNRNETIFLYYALARIGAVTVWLSTRWSSEEFIGATERTEVRYLVVEPVVRHNSIADTLSAAVPEIAGSTFGALRSARLPELRGVISVGGRLEGAVPWIAIRERGASGRSITPAPVAPTDVAMMVFTSGSTAFPRAAMLTHGGIARNARAHSARLRVTEEDRWCTAMPFFHVGGTVWGLGTCAARGACLVYLPVFDPERMLDAIGRYRCTVQFGVETMIRDELALPTFDRHDLSSLRLSAAGAPTELRREVRERFGVPTILSMYGMTEAHGNVAVTGPDDTIEQQDTTMGRPHADVRVEIADPETDGPLPAGMEGEIVLSGRGLFAGYYGDAAATRAVLGDDGRLHSGDLGVLDGDGHLTFRARLKEMIRVGGENVSLAEVERIVMAHPAIERAYAVGVPHDRLVETVAVFARRHDGAEVSADELRAYCASRLAQYKVPTHVFFVQELPLGSSGRVSKAQLRDDALRRLRSAS